MATQKQFQAHQSNLTRKKVMKTLKINKNMVFNLCASFLKQSFLDLNFDVHILSGERGVDLTHLAEKFGRLQDGFIELLKIDQKQRNEFDQIREIDKAKSSLSVCNYLNCRFRT